MKRFPSRLLCILLAALLLTVFVACDSRYLSACQQTLDESGFDTLRSHEDFFALGKTFSVDGKTLDSLLIYDYTTAHGSGKTNLTDTFGMKSETVPEENGKYAKTYQYLMTYSDLDGLTLPENIKIGDSLLSVLEALTGEDDCLEDFEPSKEAVYDMTVCESDTATITLRDMSRAEDATGYRFTYQILYTDTNRTMTESGSLLLTRTLILSFDNDADGNPLTMIEVTVEARHRI